MTWANRILGPRLLAILFGAFLGLLTSLPHLTSPSNTVHINVQTQPRRHPQLLPPASSHDHNDGILEEHKEPLPKVVISHDNNDGILEVHKELPQKVAPTPFRLDTSKLGEIVNPHPWTYIIEPKNACKKQDLFMIAYVHTAPDNFDRRMHIRKTWGDTSLYDHQMEVFFMLGRAKTRETQRAIEAEAKEYEDIVQESLVDAYTNLSHKAVGAMRWATLRCKQIKFILKTDDDVFINTFSIIKHLHDLDQAKENNTGLLMCLVWYKMHVLRDGKWNISRDVIPDDLYPPYCSGMGYIMSLDIAEAIYKASQYVPFFWVDDVYITGMVPGKIGLKQIDIVRLFMGRKEIEFILGGPDWFKYFFSHLRDMPFNQKMWKLLVKRAQSEKIPDVPVKAGRIALKYGPKKPPQDAQKKAKPPPKKKEEEILL